MQTAFPSVRVVPVKRGVLPEGFYLIHKPGTLESSGHAIYANAETASKAQPKETVFALKFGEAFLQPSSSAAMKLQAGAGKTTGSESPILYTSKENMRQAWL